MIPVRMPIMSGKLILNVMDLDKVTDEQAGSLIFNYKDLIQRGQKSFFWANIYGAPGQEEVKLIDSNSGVADEMNKDPSKATKWKGRILIGIETEPDCEAPKCGVESMGTEPAKDTNGDPIPGSVSMVQLAEQFVLPKKFRLMYEFYSCLNIPEKLGKFNLQLAVAEKTWSTSSDEKSRVIGYNYNRWS